jgi:tetratricopeptide (TPR) repeat protein
MATIVAGYLTVAGWFPWAYVAATYEDLPGEWAQTWLFTIAAALATRSALVDRRYRASFTLLALALGYAVLEEISWGQRLLGIESPAFFRHHNLQQETNLHNLLVGPFGSTARTLIEVLLSTALVGYGALYPLLWHRRVTVARWLEARGLVPPPGYLAPYFLVAAGLELGLLAFNEAEVAELLVGMALAFLCVHCGVAARHGLDPAMLGRNLSASRACARGMATAAFVAAVLAAATTATLWSIPSQRELLEGRLTSGYEKFAGRYEQLGRISIAAELWRRVHKRQPSRSYVLRRLADARRALGDEEGFALYARQALDIALAHSLQRPEDVAVNVALARCYEQLGEDSNAEFYGQRALRLATIEARAAPASANAAYWLGRTARDLGDYPLALAELRKAHDLEPGSARYRRAYDEIREFTQR